MTTAYDRAFRLYKQYKTTTAEYKALAAQLGYESSGDLNAVFNKRLNAQRDTKRRARLALLQSLRAAAP